MALIDCPNIAKFGFDTGVVPASVSTKGLMQVDKCDAVQIANNVVAAGTQIAFFIVGFMVLYGGFLMLTSTGNEAKVKAARQTIIRSVIGLAIVIGAGVILKTVFNILGIDVSLLPFN